MKSNAPSVSEVWRIAHLPTVGTRRTSLEHVDASQRHGKRYRNERSVFTLSDSDSDIDTMAYSSEAKETSEPKVQSLM